MNNIKSYVPVDPNAQECVKKVMKFLSDITGSKVITGQHTQTMAMEELCYVKK